MADPGTIHISVFATSFDGRYHPRFPFGDAQSQLSAIAAGVASASGSLKAQASIAAGAHGKISALGVLTAPGGGGGGSTGVLVFLVPGSLDLGATFPVQITVPIIAGNGIYTGPFTSTGLPPGMTWASDGNNNGVLLGTPSATGIFVAQLNAADSVNNTGSVTVICNVS